ncbi:ATP-dependent helicase [Photobacterium sp. TY1-4]|uniref:ATP-dependent helicase n=1 Tax=Photobacterium sp. TY1-4 TaxID=2899122 RepID=UPI0021BF7542|nr:ATP-dependent helicase [Photobacterium sp. TY1-4]UXI00106.1 ATP-dependent helicase [Photobacterium sp. TY1-4]
MTRYTPEQIAFIHHDAGNALCIAGAGTGKTTTLVGLIEQKLAHIPPSEMLVLMFNRDIRTDFQQKLRDHGIGQAVPVHTFHSFCLRLLNQTGFLAQTGFRVDYQSGESDKSLVKQVLRSIAAGEQNYQRQQMIKDPKTIELLLSFIGLVKAYMLPPREVFQLAEISRDYLFILDGFEQFESLRKQHRVLFFDDWLVESVKLLESNEAIRSHYHQHCKLVVVDEFQDINTAQYRLLKQLLGPQTQLLAVGDVDQCIYKWRGSAPQFMLNFEQDFAPAKTYTLSRTFRFGHSLALSASHLIANNKQRFHDFLTVSDTGVDDTRIEVCGTSRQVGEIAQSIQKDLAAGGDPSQQAILVRRWSQTLLFELAFLSKQVPYHMPVPSVLASSREVKLLIELMSLATGRYDQWPVPNKGQLLFNLMSFPHCYVPNKTLRPLCDQLAGMDSGQWLTFIGRFEKANSNLKLENLIERLDLLVRLQRKGSFKALEVFNQYRNESGLDNWIWKTEATATEIEEAVERLDSVATVLDTMDQPCEKALQYFEYYTQQSVNHDREAGARGVQLTTIFRAKGCEYDRVYLPFWDKDAFPYLNKYSGSIGADIEEERRLAYVAMTRAKQQAMVYFTEPEVTAANAGKATNASTFVLEAKAGLAKEVGPLLYEEGELPYHASPIVTEYYKRLGREGDVQAPCKEPPEQEAPRKEAPEQTEPTLDAEAFHDLASGLATAAGQGAGQPDYSYGWALRQPLPDNATKVLQAMIRTKTAKYLDGELSRLRRELKSAAATKQQVLVNRLIVAAHARSRVRR